MEGGEASRYFETKERGDREKKTRSRSLGRDPTAGGNEPPPGTIHGNDVRSASADASVGTERDGREQSRVEFVERFQLADELLAAQVAARAPQTLHEDPRRAIGRDLQGEMMERETFLPNQSAEF